MRNQTEKSKTKKDDNLLEHLEYIKEILNNSKNLLLFLEYAKDKELTEETKQAKNLLDNQLYNNLIISIEEIENIKISIYEFIKKGGVFNG